MIVAFIAAVLAMTGSAFAARALITGADIQDGSITRADLSGRTVRSLKGRRGPAGPAGHDGFAGPQGPQGSTGDKGDRGPAGPTGPQGPKGTTGDTGRQGPTGLEGPQGVDGPQGPAGPQGTPGQSIVDPPQSFGPADVGTPVAQTSSGPDNTEGTEISNGGIFLPAGSGERYKVDVFVSYVDTANPGTEFGVGRLFLDGEAVTTTGNSQGGVGNTDATVVTPDIPNDSSNPGQATGSFLITPGGGGQQLTLRGALRTDDATTTANVTATVLVTRIG